MSELTYLVEGMSCSSCSALITEELSGLAGVERVEVDLDSKRVLVQGAGLDDAAVRALLAEVGYEARPAVS